MKGLVPSTPPLLSLAVLGALLLLSGFRGTKPDGAAPSASTCSVIEDFEEYSVGDAPHRWFTNKGRDLIQANTQSMSPSHQLTIEREDGDKYVRMRMKNYAYRLIKLNVDHFDEWNLDRCPMLSWEWRVTAYPQGANEQDRNNNDVAAAVYVTFGRDWLGRPKSIKYTYSSTLPVGTTVSYGPLKVLVVASAADGSPVGEWMHFKRDVVRDYENLFGEAPGDATPLGIQLFSDADVSASRSAVADFDDVRVLPE